MLSYLAEIEGWVAYDELLNEEKKKLDELMSAEHVSDPEANAFKPGQQYEPTRCNSNCCSYGDLDVDSEVYNEGKDNDFEDLNMPDDEDLDSTADFDDYDIYQAEILLNKQEVEAFA